MKVKVKSEGPYCGAYDWYVVCDDHGDSVTTFSWDSAMEAAWGHIAMQHKREK